MLRIGHSRDIHKFGENRKLVLGTVEIDYPLGLVGHSDADCLLHAIVEALIGAMGLGDIGKHYPDTDPKYKDMPSSYFLLDVKRMLQENHYQIVNIDCTIMIEKPMMAPHIPVMKDNIAHILDIDINQINIKATRGEGLGFVGEGKGVECDCVCLIENTGAYFKKL